MRKQENKSSKYSDKSDSKRSVNHTNKDDLFSLTAKLPKKILSKYKHTQKNKICENKGRNKNTSQSMKTRHEPQLTKKKLQSMDDYEFEELVGKIWEANGWNTHVTSGSGDKGIDVIATRDGKTNDKVLIQAKRYKKGNNVGSPEIRKYATLYQQDPETDSVIVVTTSSFTGPAKKLAKKLEVELIDGDKLSELLSK